MVKIRIAVCSLIVFALMLVLSSVQCGAEQGEKPEESARGMVNTEGFRAELEDIYITVKINIHPSGGSTWTIKTVAPKGPDICKGMEWPFCEGTQFFWTVIAHQMAAGERVIIRKAPNAPSCFNWDEWIIEGPNSAITSGPVTCEFTSEEAKYGIFWPYDVLFEIQNDEGEWEEKARTDPRGILH